MAEKTGRAENTEKAREKEELLGIRILKSCRKELYRYYPYLDGAFAGIAAEATRETDTIGTDGNLFLFSADYLLPAFAEDSGMVCRGYLHMLLHCLFLHLLRDRRYEERSWNLASDLAAEQLLERESMGRPGLQDGRTGKLQEIRRGCLEILGDRAASAEQIYGMLEQGQFLYPFEELEAAFRFDDHRFWRALQDEKRAAGIRKKWEAIQVYSGQRQGGAAHAAGSTAGDGAEELTLHRGGRYDYRKFLKRFAVLREEVELDPESFDYIYYSYGMEAYGNVPLIEPLEYKEVNRLEELVIAIDTSGSCSAEMVEQFLAETYEILEEKENFFSRMNVHLIQCDCCIQDVRIIHSEEEWKACGTRILIQGRGGTDFRPVFRYIQEQREKKELRNLRALIYFTDGDGIFPGEAPDYETAFISVSKSSEQRQMPRWAYRFCTALD